MNPRQAFEIFFRFHLESMVEGGYIDLNEEDREKFVKGAESDPDFYDSLSDFIAEYIEDVGENYGI